MVRVGDHAALVAAYRTLFATAAPPLPTQLERLSTQELRRVFRRRAMQCHPDRARAVNRPAEVLRSEFDALSRAHDLLEAYINSRGAKPVAATPITRTRTAADSDRWRGTVPITPLPFGEFLYYSRRISRQRLEAGLAWQRQMRPSFGALARQWGLLSEDRLGQLLARRRPGERIAAAAVRLGFLSQTQCQSLLAMQQRQQKPLGSFFVAVGAMTEPEVRSWLDAHWRHNAGSWRVEAPAA